MPTLDTDLFYPFLGFAGLVTVASLWNLWSGEMFPPEKDPTGNPESWTETELRRWLKLTVIKMRSRCTCLRTGRIYTETRTMLTMCAAQPHGRTEVVKGGAPRASQSEYEGKGIMMHPIADRRWEAKSDSSEVQS
ncbi:hypothetical protein CLCR_02113 [Cladophialophora carrionii]|uniref:Uncharacterized protein n=1 Tax=Cladophialophora carrionii TaxID=86049 RepID=A0A1C1CD65_9EURO|nr:hypothetical protein CLCR_02113 [Cladophialophora carrionii]